MSAFDVFARLSLFKDVSYDELFSLIPRITLEFKTCQAGEELEDSDTEPIGLLYLLQGEVVGRYQEHTLHFKANDLLAFAGLYGSDRRHFLRLTAVGEVRLLSLDAKSLSFLMQQHAAILHTYLGWLSDVVDPIRCLRALESIKQP